MTLQMHCQVESVMPIWTRSQLLEWLQVEHQIVGGRVVYRFRYPSSFAFENQPRQLLLVRDDYLVSSFESLVYNKGYVESKETRAHYVWSMFHQLVSKSAGSPKGRSVAVVTVCKFMLWFCVPLRYKKIPQTYRKRRAHALKGALMHLQKVEALIKAMVCLPDRFSGEERLLELSGD